MSVHFFIDFFGIMLVNKEECCIFVIVFLENVTTKNILMKLSVIVPVYNVEKFLPRCLDSLLRQGMEVGEWEVICVNDGSSDGCADILLEYEVNHPDIFRIITLGGKGPGPARDAGTAVARGEWVTYLDSDDYVVDGGYRYLLDHFCRDECGIKRFDVLCFSFRPIYTDGVTLADPDAKPDGEVIFEGDGAEAFNRWTQWNVWTKFYRLSFLKESHIKSEIVISQDALFNFDVFCKNPQTCVVSSSIIRYENGNADSIQKTVNKESVLVHLSDLYYDMKRVQRYLDEGKTELAPAAYILIESFKKTYYKKILYVSLTRDEWKRYMKTMDVSKMGRGLNIRNEDSLAAKAVLYLKKMAGHSYPEYRFVHFFHKNLFKRFLFARIIAK